MLLSLSKKASLIAQSEIRAMTLECARVGGINLAQGVCDTELPLTGHFLLKTLRELSLPCSTLTKVGLTPSMPQGAYYVLADVSRLPGRTSKDKAMFILEKTGVASVPDEAFFHKPGSSQFVRFCFAKRDDELGEAARRIWWLE